MPFSFFSQRAYPESELSDLGIESSSGNCIIASYDSEPKLKVETCQSLQSDKNRYGICQYTPCTTKEKIDCVFPFRSVGKIKIITYIEILLLKV